jgi:DNA topoisomerase IA
MYNLIICEKPSVAASISAVLGANKRENGFFIGGNHIVAWCFGHLLELAPPDAYDERYSKWRYEDLPIVVSSPPIIWFERLKESGQGSKGENLKWVADVFTVHD